MHAGLVPADIDLLEEVYWFARARAEEKTQKRGMDEERVAYYRDDLRRLQWAYAEAKQDPRTPVVAAAIDLLRKAAMRDQDHPDYDPLWTLPS